MAGWTWETRYSWLPALMLYWSRDSVRSPECLSRVQIRWRQRHKQRHTILRPLSEQMIQINVDINMCFYDSLVIIWALRYHHFTPDCTALIWKRNSKYMFYKGFWSPVKVMFCYYLVIVIPLSSAFPTMCSYRDLLCVKELWTRLSGSCMLINFSGKAKCGKYAYVVFNRSKHKHGCLLIHPVPGNSHFLEHDKYLNIYNR